MPERSKIDRINLLLECKFPAAFGFSAVGLCIAYHFTLQIKRTNKCWISTTCTHDFYTFYFFSLFSYFFELWMNEAFAWFCIVVEIDQKISVSYIDDFWYSFQKNRLQFVYNVSFQFLSKIKLWLLSIASLFGQCHVFSFSIQTTTNTIKNTICGNYYLDRDGQNHFDSEKA